MRDALVEACGSMAQVPGEALVLAGRLLIDAEKGEDGVALLEAFLARGASPARLRGGIGGSFAELYALDGLTRSLGEPQRATRWLATGAAKYLPQEDRQALIRKVLDAAADPDPGPASHEPAPAASSTTAAASASAPTTEAKREPHASATVAATESSKEEAEGAEAAEKHRWWDILARAPAEAAGIAAAVARGEDAPTRHALAAGLGLVFAYAAYAERRSLCRLARRLKGYI